MDDLFTQRYLYRNFMYRGKIFKDNGVKQLILVF